MQNLPEYLADDEDDSWIDECDHSFLASALRDAYAENDRLRTVIQNAIYDLANGHSVIPDLHAALVNGGKK